MSEILTANLQQSFTDRRNCKTHSKELQYLMNRLRGICGKGLNMGYMCLYGM